MSVISVAMKSNIKRSAEHILLHDQIFSCCSTAMPPYLKQIKGPASFRLKAHSPQSYRYVRQYPSRYVHQQFDQS